VKKDRKGKVVLNVLELERRRLRHKREAYVRKKVKAKTWPRCEWCGRHHDPKLEPKPLKNIPVTAKPVLTVSDFEKDSSRDSLPSEKNETQETKETNA